MRRSVARRDSPIRFRGSLPDDRRRRAEGEPPKARAAAPEKGPAGTPDLSPLPPFPRRTGQLLCQQREPRGSQFAVMLLECLVDPDFRCGPDDDFLPGDEDE